MISQLAAFTGGFVVVRRVDYHTDLPCPAVATATTKPNLLAHVFSRNRRAVAHVAHSAEKFNLPQIRHERSCAILDLPPTLTTLLTVVTVSLLLRRCIYVRTYWYLL